MFYKVSTNKKSVEGNIRLTSSKSESNRVLIIRALCKNNFVINNLAEADDTKTLINLLSSDEYILDAGPAGTTLRFLTAYLAIKSGEEHILTGSKRMQERPIALLADALNSLGADINYEKNHGFPPLKIKGKQLTGNEITIDGSISSQYITALLLIAPVLPDGLKINISGNLTSKPYIEMTLKIMNYFGISSSWENNAIIVKNQDYISREYTIEGDWSSVSYLYEIVALSKNAELIIFGLNQQSLQGDSAISKIMEKLGVKTEFIDGEIKLSKTNNIEKNFSYDFSDCPDIAQTVAVTCAGLGINAKLSGLKTLKIKETDRVNALVTELEKLGVDISEPIENVLEIKSGNQLNNNINISTYKDHRMAMAFAPLAMVIENINIEEPDVVSKSYPDYWNDLSYLGFSFSKSE